MAPAGILRSVCRSLLSNSPEQAQEILDLVMRFYGQTVLELDDGRGITLYVFPDDECEDDLALVRQEYLKIPLGPRA